MTRKINSIPPKRLAETITAAATSFKLNDILGFDGIALTESIIGDTVYCSFQDTTGRYLEFMKIDPATIASASITILKRGLSFNEDGTETEVPGNKRQWIKNQTIVNLGTDTPAMFNLYVKTADNQTIAGVKTFSSSPIVPTPTTDMQASTKKYVDDNLDLKLDDSQLDTDITLAANSDLKIPSQKAIKKYVDDTASYGAPLADEDTAGIVEIATQAQVDAGTDDGETGAKLVMLPSQLALITSKTYVAGEDITANDSLFVAKGDETRQISAYSTDVSVNENLGNSTTAWIYQSFTTGPNTTMINRIRLYGAYSGNYPGGGGTVRIRSTPSGSDLASATFSVGVFLGSEDIDIGPLTVTPNTTYYIVVSKINQDNFTNKMFRGGTSSSYSGGVSGISSDSGANWTTPSTTVTGDFAFQVLEGDYVAGKVYKTIASTTNHKGTGLTANFIGFALATVSAGANAIARAIGIKGGFSGLTPGATYYLSNTAGAISSSAGTTSKKIGLALSATDLLIKHDN